MVLGNGRDGGGATRSQRSYTRTAAGEREGEEGKMEASGRPQKTTKMHQEGNGRDGGMRAGRKARWAVVGPVCILWRT